MIVFLLNARPENTPPSLSHSVSHSLSVTLYLSSDVVIVKCHLTNHLFTYHRSDMSISITMVLTGKQIGCGPFFVLIPVSTLVLKYLVILMSSNASIGKFDTRVVLT